MKPKAPNKYEKCAGEIEDYLAIESMGFIKIDSKKLLDGHIQEILRRHFQPDAERMKKIAKHHGAEAFHDSNFIESVIGHVEAALREMAEGGV